MRRQFNQFKDLIHNKAISRNDRNEVLSPSVVHSEKHVEHIKTSLSNAEKKISGSLLSGTSGDSSSATPEKKIKKLPSSSLSNCFNEASELLSSSKNDSVLGKTLHLCSQLQKESTTILATHEVDVETQCINKIQGYVNEDLPSISRSRKNLNRTHSDLNASKVKYESMRKSMDNSSQVSPHQAENKLETLKKEVEDNQNKLYQCRDAYETELLDFLSKEISIAKVFYDYVKLQAAYHEKMLAQINHYIPVLEGVIANTSQKPAFGVALEEHLRISGQPISPVIETCINILQQSVSEEGLFRISGSVSKVKLIRNAFNAGQFDSLDLQMCDVHAVASTLKSYLRELPEPLLTHHLYTNWIQAASERDPEERLKSIWKVCNDLPEANKNNLRYMIKFLNELTKHSEQNKMSSQNLAIAIGPSLLWSTGEGMELITNYSPILIESLITYCDYFFPGEVIFDTTKHKSVDSISDNSDQEINNASKLAANYRIKKKAPKPPPGSSNDNSTSIFDSVSSSIDSTTNKLKSKFGSLRSKSNNNKQSSHEEPSPVESPPVATSLATVRRNHLSPRGDNSRSRRPISICERPVVPPPEIPPRPTANLLKPGQSERSLNDSNLQRYSMGDLTAIDSRSIDEESEDSQEDLLSSSGQENSKSVAALYPSLSGMDNHLAESPFTYPCSEFIDENQPYAYASTENFEIDGHKSNNSLIPQKPPRSSLSSTQSSATDSSSELTRTDKSPPPLPLRPSKSPSPIPSAMHSNTPANLVQSERTYL